MGRIKSPAPNPGGKIKPREETAGSTDGERPVFCLKHLVRGWRISDCEATDQASFAVTIEKLAEMTWQAIKNTQRHGLGTEKINQNAIRPPIPASITEDVSFLAFRFSGKKPMVGFRSNAVFHIVWFDRNFTLYDHG